MEEITLVEKDDGTFEGTYKYKNYNYTVQGKTEEELRQNAEAVKKKIDEGCKSGSIGNSAFWDCSSLTQIKIPSSVKSIGNSAFWNCSSLTQIEIPSSVKSIDKYAFYDCSSLTQIIIPSSVTQIGDGAFLDCINLQEITFPKSFESEEDENSLKMRLGLNDKAKIRYADVTIDPIWKWILFGVAAAVCIAAIVAMFVVPGAQALLIGPLIAIGVPKIAAIVATVAQFVGMALTSVGIARGIVKFTDIVLGPVRMVASAVKFAAEVVLGILSPILPNIWLANSYAFLNNLIYKINGVKNLECKAEERKIENKIDNEPLLLTALIKGDISASTTLTTVQKVLNFFKNVAFGILTPIAKVGIFVGNFVFNLLLMPIDMYVKPFMSKRCVKKVNKGIGYVNSKFGEGLDAMSNSQMNAPVMYQKIYSIKNRVSNAKDKSKEQHVNQQNHDCNFFK